MKTKGFSQDEAELVKLDIRLKTTPTEKKWTRVYLMTCILQKAKKYHPDDAFKLARLFIEREDHDGRQLAFSV